MNDTTIRSGTHVGGTVVACVIAPIILLIGAGLAGGIWAIATGLFTVIRPGVIGFIAAIVGAYVGCYAARAACDSVLKSYSRRAVFIELAILLIAAIAFELSLPFGWERAAPIAQAVAMLLLCWSTFWNGEKLA